MKSVIESGLGGDVAEVDVEKHFRVVRALVKTFEDAARLGVEDKGVQVVGLRLTIPGGQQEQKEDDRDTRIAYSKRHTGLFPFPHDHKTVTITWTGADGNEYSLDIEYPVNIEWPIIGEL